MNWLNDHLKTLILTEAHEGYLLGRGGKDTTISRIDPKTWVPLSEPSPSSDFNGRYGEYGEKLDGWLLWPLISPRGRVVGFSGRPVPDKRIMYFLLREAGWTPLWTGMAPDQMEKIWGGADIWIVEGLFDLFALEWAVPEGGVVLSSQRARLSFKHVEFLRRYCSGWVRMVYDNDDTGRKGVLGWVDDTGRKKWGALQKLERVGVTAVDVPYRGKDPGEIWSKQGAAGIRAAFT